jgi:cellulose synthase/poly-beta-1,6-N-acetylglucosamine synthase-like glycosyltransferase
MSFAQWTDGIGFRQRQTNILGGQASLFRVRHLQQVVDQFDRPSPWVNTTDVEDAELSQRLHALDKKTMMSAQARAYAGSMDTVVSLKAQQKKWSLGHSSLWWNDKSYTKHSRYFVNQQIGLALNGIARLLLVIMLTLSLSANQFEWNPLWLLPILVTMLVNLKTAIRVPHRTAGDIIYALLVLPGELWLIAQIWISFTGWLNIWFGTKVDGWAKQYAAERGDPTQRVLGKFLAYSLLAVVVSTAGIWAWLSRTPADLQTTILTDGWLVLSGLTIFLTIGGVVRLVRPTRGLRP